MGLAIVGSGAFQANLTVGVSAITQDTILGGSLPPTNLSLFTVISQSNSSNRYIEVFYDNGSLYAITNVAQSYMIRWVSFATR